MVTVRVPFSIANSPAARRTDSMVRSILASGKSFDEPGEDLFDLFASAVRIAGVVDQLGVGQEEGGETFGILAIECVDKARGKLADRPGSVRQPRRRSRPGASG